MDTVNQLWRESRGEIIGGLVVATILGLLSWLTENSEQLSIVAIHVLNTQLRLWTILLVLGLGVVGFLAVRIARRYQRTSINTSDSQQQFFPPLPADSPSRKGEMFYSCFISYSSKDQIFVEKLHTDLKHHGVDVWFAPEDLPIGAKTRIALDESVLEKHKLLLILSQHSVTSDWVEQEVETAFEKERETDTLVLFPIRIDNAVMELKAGWAAHIRRTRNIGDFRQWQTSAVYQKQLQRLLRDLTRGEEEDGQQRTS